MAKETALRSMVYAGIGLVIAEAAFAAFVAIPRMALHPAVVEFGTVHSHWTFVIFKLIVAAALLAFVIPNRHNLGRIKALLNLAGIVVIVLNVPLFSSAVFYSGRYGYYDVANLLSIRIVANLIAGILFIAVPIMLRRSTSTK